MSGGGQRHLASGFWLLAAASTVQEWSLVGTRGWLVIIASDLQRLCARGSSQECNSKSMMVMMGFAIAGACGWKRASVGAYLPYLVSATCSCAGARHDEMPERRTLALPTRPGNWLQLRVRQR